MGSADRRAGPRPAAARPTPQAQRALARTLLGRAAGFRDCPPEPLDRLVAAMRVRTYPPRAIVASRNRDFGFMALVLDGLLDASIIRADGHRPLVGIFRRGDLFGILDVIDGLGQANDIAARVESSVALVPVDVVRAELATTPALAIACARQLASRSRANYARMAVQGVASVDVRVAWMLSLLADRYGAPEHGRIVIDVHLSQADLADWTGASRQRVNGALKRLEADGIVALGYASVTVLDRRRLAARAEP